LLPLVLALGAHALGLVKQIDGGKELVPDELPVGGKPQLERIVRRRFAAVMFGCAVMRRDGEREAYRRCRAALHKLHLEFGRNAEPPAILVVEVGDIPDLEMVAPEFERHMEPVRRIVAEFDFGLLRAKGTVELAEKGFVEERQMPLANVADYHSVAASETPL